jgi:choline dehydrogenase-like flavoprotein
MDELPVGQLTQVVGEGEAGQGLIAADLGELTAPQTAVEGGGDSVAAGGGQLGGRLGDDHVEAARCGDLGDAGARNRARPSRGAATYRTFTCHEPCGFPRSASSLSIESNLVQFKSATLRLTGGLDRDQERLDEGGGPMTLMTRTIETDRVVVCGGGAGGALATRLSKDAAREVLSLEAGRDWRSADAPPQLRSMNGWRALDGAACADFQWPGIESRRSRAQAPRPHVRGRGLGGSSSVSIAAIRAVPDDYERWAASGCPGWSCDEMLPYLRRMEADADFGDWPYHGGVGPVPVQRLGREAWGPADHALAEAALGLGHPWCDDHNGPTGTGVSPYGISSRDGARVTTNDGYLEPVRHRPNLRVFGGATVDQVLVEGGRATSVRVRMDMMIVSVNQTLALPDPGDSHLVAEGARGPWGGAGGGRSPGGPGLLCLWADQEFSRGRLRLASPDPDVHPDMDQDLLSDSADLVRMRDGVKRAIELVRTGSFNAAFEHISVDLTGRGVDAVSDDAAIDRRLMETVGDTGHIRGTCRMGAPDDPRTVVGPAGRVLGVDGLWVADASVFPEVPRANTNLPAIAAAERLSDLIRGAVAPAVAGDVVRAGS